MTEENNYKEDMQQIWMPGEVIGTIQDQYGFIIQKAGKYWLNHKGYGIMVPTYSQEAAKEISLVLINDKIMHK